eukprot:jgi/Mesen1/5846/ME000298S05114
MEEQHGGGRSKRKSSEAEDGELIEMDDDGDFEASKRHKKHRKVDGKEGRDEKKRRERGDSDHKHKHGHKHKHKHKNRSKSDVDCEEKLKLDSLHLVDKNYAEDDLEDGQIIEDGSRSREGGAKPKKTDDLRYQSERGGKDKGDIGDLGEKVARDKPSGKEREIERYEKRSEKSSAEKVTLVESEGMDKERDANRSRKKNEEGSGEKVKVEEFRGKAKERESKRYDKRNKEILVEKVFVEGFEGKGTERETEKSELIPDELILEESKRKGKEQGNNIFEKRSKEVSGEKVTKKEPRSKDKERETKRSDRRNRDAPEEKVSLEKIGGTDKEQETKMSEKRIKVVPGESCNDYNGRAKERETTKYEKRKKDSPEDKVKVEKPRGKDKELETKRSVVSPEAVAQEELMNEERRSKEKSKHESRSRDKLQEKMRGKDEPKKELKAQETKSSGEEKVQSRGKDVVQDAEISDRKKRVPSPARELVSRDRSPSEKRQRSRSRDRLQDNVRDKTRRSRSRDSLRDRDLHADRRGRQERSPVQRRRSRSRDSLRERRDDYDRDRSRRYSREHSIYGDTRGRGDYRRHRDDYQRGDDRHRYDRYPERERRDDKNDEKRSTKEQTKEEDNQEEFVERVASQIAEQEEEDDVEKVKEESRRRRQAILEKYKQQQEQQKIEASTSGLHAAAASANTSATVKPVGEEFAGTLTVDARFGSAGPTVTPPSPDAPSDALAQVDQVAGSPVDGPIFEDVANGKAAPDAAAVGVQEGGVANGDYLVKAGQPDEAPPSGGPVDASPKSTKSADMFTDDIFGDSPTEGRRAMKLDGAAVEVGGLTDNWDDAEGYYTSRIGEVLDGRYEVTLSLGKGVFSTVVRATDLKAGPGEPPEVAIKLIRNNETMYKAGQQELVILRKLAGADPEMRRHCVWLHSSFDYRNHLCLVFESMHMNLREILKKFGRNIGINLSAVRAYATQLFIALKHLRNCGVLHCDIKPDNMLVNESKNVLKLADFGSAMFAGENEITPYLVSRFYRAPEIMLGLPYDHALDMWSVGCCIYELYTGKMLFPGRTNNDMLRLHMELKGPFPKKMLKKATFLEQHFDADFNFCSIEEDPVTQKTIKRIITSVKPKDMGALLAGPGSAEEEAKFLHAFRDLLDKIFVLDPDKRITVSQALAHPFISGKW